METVLYHKFRLLANRPEITHGFFTRKGGVSSKDFAGLNVGENVNDNQSDVFKNIQKVKKALGICSLARLNQVHGKAVVEADPLKVCDADSHMTSKKELGLMVRFADCQGALFYDPVLGKIAACHAGWKGLCQNIYQATVLAMGSNPKDLIVCIGPSIGPKHFKHMEFPETFKQFEETQNHYNLWDLAEWQLEKLGVKLIEIARICSYDDSENYYSFRRSNKTGRNCSIIALSNI